MKTLIVTASSKTKRSQNEMPFLASDKRFIEGLDNKTAKTYQTARNDLLSTLKFNKGPDTNSNLEPDSTIQYLPAYLRYTGRTYSKISSNAWESLVNSPESFDCVILSAFYGLIRYDEPIRNYDIKQVTKLPSGQAIGKYWRDQGASDWLFNYIKNTGVDEVKFVLSTSYSDIIRKNQLMTRLKEELGLSSEDQQFKEGGMKSMLLRGEYIDNLLLKQLD